MSKAEKYIEENTKLYSNISADKTMAPWLTPEQAKKAVEIAREEMYEWLEKNAVNFVGFADNEHPAIGDTKAFYGTKSLIYYLKQVMKDE